MFYRYEIVNQNGNKALYLYLTMNEEASRELGEGDSSTFENKVKDYIKSRNINYDEGEIFIVADGVIVKNMNIKNKDISIEVLDEKTDYSNIKYLVTLKKEDTNKSITLKDYLMGALFNNNCYNYPDEVIKSITILYRTYVYYKMDIDKFINDDDFFISYKDPSYYKLLFVDNYEDMYKKLENAVNETDSLFITYNNKYILPFIHHTNNGFTEIDSRYPYLEKRYSLWDLLSPKYINTREFTYKKLENLLGIKKEEFKNFKILELTSGNRVKKLKIGNNTYSGEEFAKLLGLTSCDMTVLINDHSIKIITRGNGHGLGLSISGSSELANSGCGYLQILDYYFPKCIIKKYI